jgi:5'-3' exoribonuclease 2
MDIPALAENITIDMNNGIELTEEQRHKRLYDYIFICFFLGNDFMPHFPSINIRTGGVHKMLNAYKATIGVNDNLTDGKNIIWKNVRKYFLSILSRKLS